MRLNTKDKTKQTKFSKKKSKCKINHIDEFICRKLELKTIVLNHQTMINKTLFQFQLKKKKPAN